MPSPRLYTIGVYGFDADAFFTALTTAEIDLFCDIRARRGVRGRDYAFANSRRLQERLADLSIRYLHRPDLAPSQALRSRQHQQDKTDKIARRKRQELAPVFVDGYHADVIAGLDSVALLAELMPTTRIVFCCVEPAPTTCHRGLLAAKLAGDLGLMTEHLMPRGIVNCQHPIFDGQ